MAGGNVLHIRNDVGGDQNNAVMGKLRQQIAEAHPLAGIQSPGRFIQNQYLRIIQQSLGNPHPAFHAAGESGDFFVVDVRQGDSLQQFADSPPAIPFGQSLQGGDISQIILHREFRIKTKLLGQKTEDIPVTLSQHPNRHTVIQHLAGGGLHNPGNHPHQSCLACAVGAQKAPDTRRQLQADIVNRFFVFKFFGNLINQQFHRKTPFRTDKSAYALVRSLYQKQKHHFLVCSHGIPLFFYGFSYDFPIKQEVLQ